MGSAERLAIAVADDDLGWSSLAIKPIEYVSALSASSSLGADLFRARDNDTFALRRAALLLAKLSMDEGRRKKLPLSRAMAQAIAVAVMVELIRPKCRTCNGSAVIVTEALKITCPSCNGAGIHRYSDRERSRLSGVKPSEWGKWERRYLMVLSLALKHDCAVAKASQRLGY